jgi:hypothetical protein
MIDLFLLGAGQPLDEGIGEVQHLLDEGGVRPEVRLRIERVIAASRSVGAGHVALDVMVEVADLQPGFRTRGVVVGAVDRVEYWRDRAPEPLSGIGEEGGVVKHALAEFGEHVLQHRGTRPNEIHPVVAKVAPDQRLRA